jgi:lysyl-tRNA synthetase class 2
VRRLGGANGAVHFHGAARLFPLTLAALGFVSVAALLVIAFAPVRTRAGLNNEQARARVRTMTNRADGDTLDPFALRADKQHVFSPDGRAAVAYRYVAGVGLASGDPVGSPDAFPDALAAFLALCDERGWRPAVMGVRNERLDLYLDAGLSAWYLGDEAIVDVQAFTLEGRAMRDVRQAVSRTHNFGIVTEFHYEGELPGDLRGQLLAIAERGRRGAPERGFSMALDGLLSGRDRDCVIVVARTDDGRPFAFQRYVPCRAGSGLSLDAMRRDEDIGPNGVNERMIVDTIEWSHHRQVTEVSLNFAFCRALIDPPDTLGLGERAQAWVIQRLNPHFQIESLLRFNAKFRPRWVPRSIVYRSLGDLTPVGAAAARAEGFLPFGVS